MRNYTVFTHLLNFYNEGLGTTAAFLARIVRENVWTVFFDGQVVDPREAPPTQVHAIVAYQVRIAMNRLRAKGKGKGNEEGHTH